METSMRDASAMNENATSSHASVLEPATIKAKHIMIRNVMTVGPHRSVHEIAQLLVDNQISAIPVVDDRKIVGIITEGDLLRRIELGTEPAFCSARSTDPECAKSGGRCAHDVMTSNVVIVTEETSLPEIARLLESKRIKHVPVTRDGGLVGIISRADLVRALVSRPEGVQGPLICDDDVVRYKVIETLMAIPGASAWLTDVTVSRGAVDLSGVVQDEDVRGSSRRLIEKLPCVVSVNDRRVIVQPYSV